MLANLKQYVLLETDSEGFGVSTGSEASSKDSNEEVEKVGEEVTLQSNERSVLEAPLRPTSARPEASCGTNIALGVET